MFDKTDKKLKLDGETEEFFKEIENGEKDVYKRGFTKYFSNEPTALVNNLLGQNTQDLRKSLDEIEQQKIELEKDERNSTNNKNGNDSLNIILSVTDRIYQFFQYKLLPGEQPDELKLPKWVKVTKQRFDVIKKEVQNAKKKKNLQARPNCSRLVTSSESDKLLQDIEHGKITYEEALKKMTNIYDDISMFLKLDSFTSNQSKILSILFMEFEIFTGKVRMLEKNDEDEFEVFLKKNKNTHNKQESDEQTGTTNMPELESKESDAQRINQSGQGLNILTPDEMLSRLPITLAQLKAGNNPQKTYK